MQAHEFYARLFKKILRELDGVQDKERVAIAIMHEHAEETRALWRLAEIRRQGTFDRALSKDAWL